MTKRDRHATRSGDKTRAPALPARVRASTGFPIVGIGASAGGMEAFVELLRRIPKQTGAAFVLIQHLDPTHASYLSEALGRSTGFPVEESEDGMVIKPDHVYVIPPSADVSIMGGALSLLPRGIDGHKLHLPVDFFFESLAADRGNQAIGVVLSGTGSDGSEGLRAIKAEGGVTLAQDPETAKFRGMPDAAIQAGVVDVVLPIDALAAELVRLARHPFFRSNAAEKAPGPTEDRELRQVLALVRGAVRVDFSEYKLASIRRRVARRMAVRRLATLPEYVQVLRGDRAELQALFEDILIHVTSFFRDAEAFEKLKEVAFPEILTQKRVGGTIRIWCCGCSTGEEVYSLAIALFEFLSKEGASDVPVQIFGTDIAEAAIEKARAGLYPDAAVRDIDAERLARFFVKEEGGYRISKSIRERCAFVKHDLTRDPPFSKLDLVCCRNVLIYFTAELQKRVLATFHFGLNDPGFLLLGGAENIGDGADLFSAVDKESKIFARSAGKSVLRLAPARDVYPIPPPTVDLGPRAPPPADVVKRVESALLDKYTPPGVIVNDRLEILQFRGRTARYLEPPPGPPQHDLLKMARKELVSDLRIAISRARKEKAMVRRSGIRIEENGSTLLCAVVVLPVPLAEPALPAFAVMFEEETAQGPRPVAPAVSGATPPTAPVNEQRYSALEEELERTKQFLETTVDELQRTNEEMMSANEELLSSNEELQSLNEEMETAREELQSTNEELSTLNDELQNRNTELNSANSDLINILGSVEVPIVIVDAERRIRRFTPMARSLLNLLPSDVGRPIDDIKPNLPIDKLDQKIADVIDSVTIHEEQAEGKDGRWYRLQIRPYTTVDKKIDGAVLSIVDIDSLKRALGAAEWARDFATAIVEASPTPNVVLDEQQNIVSSNEAFRETYVVTMATEGRSVYQIQNGAWDFPELRSALERVVKRHGRFRALDVERELPGLGKRWMSLSGRSVVLPDAGRIVLLTADDITEHVRGEAERAELMAEAKAAKAAADDANRSKDLFLAMVSHELRTPLSSLVMNAQRLRKGNLGEEQLRRLGESIERASKAQAQLIDDLLDISRIVAGKLKMELHAVSVPSIVQMAVDTVRPGADKKAVELVVHVDDSVPRVAGDIMRLQQVVWNLLNNAIKFTPERGRVVVAVDRDGDYARIRVTDTGTGIEAEFLPHIFDQFSQEDRERTRTHGGLGLGLSIVRYVVEKHGGTIKVESDGRDRGSTFTVLLPVVNRHAEAALGSGESGTGTRPSIKGARVLLVEDDVQTREALADMLAVCGAVVHPAASAKQALEVFKDFRAEVLISDIAMPDEDGYSLIRRIRALGASEGGDVPAVALSALAGEEDRRRAEKAGFQLHMAKPVDIDRLVGALAALLKGRASLVDADGGRARP